jgi:DNA-binding transcriptional MerR regulator
VGLVDAHGRTVGPDGIRGERLWRTLPRRDQMETPALRIGAVARRTGVAVATLRAWESRYGVLRPSRTDGGHRLYSEEDVDRVLAVLRLTAQGWSVSAAAGSVTAERTPDGSASSGRGDGRDRRHGPGTDDAMTVRLRDDLARAIRDVRCSGGGGGARHAASHASGSRSPSRTSSCRCSATSARAGRTIRR